MKTKHTNKFIMLILSVVMITSLMIGMSVTAFAAETTPAAEISGQQVNLGGDIEMKYYVKINDQSVTPDQLKLLVTFLGAQYELTSPTEKDGEYVFTFDAINPQCMGDDIDAVLYVDDEEADSLLDYTVKDNLVNTYSENTNNTIKQLIIDTLEYGAAAQTFRGYKTNALVTYGLPDAMTAHLNDEARNFDNTIPKSTPNVSETVANTVKEANVLFSTTNFIKVSYTDGETKILTSDAVAPYDFAKKMQFSVDGLFTLGYSVNDYCYDVIKAESASGNMKALARALYNYGLSAHFVKGNHSGGEDTATCVHSTICEICSHEYGDSRNPNNHMSEEFTYTANADGSTHKKVHVCCGATADESEAHTLTYSASGSTIAVSCSANCGHSGTATISATGKTYDGTALEATVTKTGSLAEVAIDVTYAVKNGETLDSTPVNAGTYTASITIGGATVSVDFTIAKADPTYSVPTGLTASCGQTLADVILSGGWAWVDSTQSVGAEGENQFDATFTPTDTTNYNTVTVKVTVSVYKPAASVDVAPRPIHREYTGDPQTLVWWPGVASGGEVQYKVGVNGTYSTEIPTATDAGTYDIFWKVVGDINHSDTAEEWIQVVIDAKDVSNAAVTLEQESYLYDGNEKKPAVQSVIVDGKLLNEGTDYTVEYANNIYVGEATVTITFKGNYSGEITKTFEITRDPDTTEFDGEWVTIPRE